ALHANGFVSTQAYPSAGSAPEILGQHVITAQIAQTGAAQYSEVETSWQPDRFQTTDETMVSENIAAQFALTLQDALPDERHDLLVDYVRQGVIRVLRLEATQIPDSHSRLLDMGLDSLMALELRSFLNSGLKLPESLPATLIF